MIHSSYRTYSMSVHFPLCSSNFHAAPCKLLHIFIQQQGSIFGIVSVWLTMHLLALLAILPAYTVFMISESRVRRNVQEKNVRFTEKWVTFSAERELLSIIGIMGNIGNLSRASKIVSVEAKKKAMHESAGNADYNTPYTLYCRWATLSTDFLFWNSIIDCNDYFMGIKCLLARLRGYVYSRRILIKHFASNIIVFERKTTTTHRNNQLQTLWEFVQCYCAAKAIFSLKHGKISKTEL